MPLKIDNLWEYVKKSSPRALFWDQQISAMLMLYTQYTHFKLQHRVLVIPLGGLYKYFLSKPHSYITC